MYATKNLNHLPVVTQFSGGDTTGIFENFGAEFARSHEVHSMFGFEKGVLDAYRKQLDLASEVLGAPLTEFEPDVSDVSLMAGRTLGYTSVWENIFGADESGAQMEKLDAELLKLKEFRPGIRTFAELLGEQENRLKEVEEQAGRVYDRRNFLGAMSSFVGGIAGSFDPSVDPVYFASLFVGGFGRTVVQRVLTEAIIGGGAETIQQFGFIKPRNEAMDIDSQVFQSILFAAIGAGVFRGGFEAVGPGYRALEGAINPQRAAARIISNQLRAVTRSGALDYGAIIRPKKLSTEDLLAAVRKLRPTQDTRIAEGELLKDQNIERKSPYPNTPEGRTQANVALLEALVKFEGDTALSRILPADPVRLPEGSPVEIMARTENADLYKTLDRTKTDLAAAQDRLTALERGQQERTVGDIIVRIDKPTGERVKVIEQELDRTIPRERRADLERELDQIVANVGEENVLKAAKETGAPDKHQLAAAQKSVRYSRERLARAKRATDAVEAKVAARSKVGEQLTPPRLPEETMRALPDEKAIEAAVEAKVERAQASLKDDPLAKLAKLNEARDAKFASIKERLTAVGKEETGLTSMGSKMGRAITDNLYDMLWARVEAGEVIEVRGHPPSVVLQAAKIARENGGLKTKAEFREFAQEITWVPRDENFQQAIRDVITKHLPKVEEVAGEVDIGLNRTVRADHLVEQMEGGAKTVKELFDDIADDEAMVLAAKSCGLPL